MANIKKENEEVKNTTTNTKNSLNCHFHQNIHLNYILELDHSFLYKNHKYSKNHQEFVLLMSQF